LYKSAQFRGAENVGAPKRASATGCFVGACLQAIGRGVQAIHRQQAGSYRGAITADLQLAVLWELGRVSKMDMAAIKVLEKGK